MAPSRTLVMPTYLVAFALIVIPPFDTVMQLMPLRPGDPRWRFGAFGLLTVSYTHLTLPTNREV